MRSPTAPDPAAVLERMIALRQECEAKAWDSLARYKFEMFGYWASHWVTVSRAIGDRRPNPFREAVNVARAAKSRTGDITPLVDEMRSCAHRNEACPNGCDCLCAGCRNWAP